jgi:hypothetical protein
MLAAARDPACPLIVPATIVAEVCYMITRYRFGSAAEAAFLRSFAEGDLVVGNLVDQDFERMAQPGRAVRQLSARRLGRQRYRHSRKALDHHDLDHRPPALHRCTPEHVEAFNLLP